jgi:hypothetical protein
MGGQLVVGGPVLARPVMACSVVKASRIVGVRQPLQSGSRRRAASSSSAGPSSLAPSWLAPSSRQAASSARQPLDSATLFPKPRHALPVNEQAVSSERCPMPSTGPTEQPTTGRAPKGPPMTSWPSTSSLGRGLGELQGSRTPTMRPPRRNYDGRPRLLVDGLLVVGELGTLRSHGPRLLVDGLLVVSVPAVGVPWWSGSCSERPMWAGLGVGLAVVGSAVGLDLGAGLGAKSSARARRGPWLAGRPPSIRRSAQLSLLVTLKGQDERRRETRSRGAGAAAVRRAREARRLVLALGLFAGRAC